MKLNYLFEQVKKDIATGVFGKSGSRFSDVKSFAEQYDISYVTAIKLIAELKNSRVLLPIGNKNFVINGPYGTNSELYKIINKTHEKKLGILVPSFTNPFIAEMTEELNDTILRCGFLPEIVLAHDEDEIAILEHFAKSGCAGVFSFLKNQTPGVLDYYSRFPLPIVIVGKNPVDINVSSVTADNYTAGMVAAKHFLEYGFKNFAYATTYNNISVNDDRLNGFRDGLKKAGITLPNENIFALDQNTSKNKNMIVSFLSKRKQRTGFFCYHDIVAAQLIIIVQNAGYSIPGHVGIIGYDNLSIVTGETKLTTFAYSFNKIAENAVSLMKEKLLKPNSPKNTINIQTVLIVRNSTNRDLNKNYQL